MLLNNSLICKAHALKDTQIYSYVFTWLFIIDFTSGNEHFCIIYPLRGFSHMKTLFEIKAVGG